MSVFLRSQSLPGLSAPPAPSSLPWWSSSPPWGSAVWLWWSSAPLWWPSDQFGLPWGSSAPPWRASIPSAPPWWAPVPSAPPWWAPVSPAPSWCSSALPWWSSALLWLPAPSNLRQVMPNFHQQVSCPTRGPNTLDHCYSQFKNAYKARSLPAFGKSDHAAIFLTPEYKQRLAQEPPVQRVVTHWSSHS